VCILIAISNGQAWGWWSSASFVGFLVAGIVLLLAWSVEQRLISYPLLDFRGMDKRQVISGYVAFMTVAAMASGLFILLPGLAETPGIFGYGLGDSVLKSSLTLMPILPAAFISSYIAKRMLHRVGPPSRARSRRRSLHHRVLLARFRPRPVLAALRWRRHIWHRGW